jgi:sugar/nucleoside kinase (ribokinase family)
MRPTAGRPLIFAGFDGFIDEIVHVVDIRADKDNYTRLETIGQFAERIAGAAGFSTNIEYVTIRTKIGGNGTIFANALLGLQNRVYYVGALGDPIHPLYRNLSDSCERAVSIAECAHTDAVEFLDGKLIISKLETLDAVNYRRLSEMVGVGELIRVMTASEMLAFMNWTMLPGMDGIWEGILSDVLPGVPAGRYAFFDLADPEKKSDVDLAAALELVKRFEGPCKVVLSMNMKEALRVAGVLGTKRDTLEATARGISEALKLHAVVVHPLKEACCVIGGEYSRVDGPYCENPVLTTGAGDNFNAGFCDALLRGATPEDTLKEAVSLSGFYVRFGQSPTATELESFMR